MQPNPDFEAEVRSALAVPEPDPAFLSSLRSQVSRPHSTRATRFAWVGLTASAIFLLAVIWMVGAETVFAEFQRLFGYIPGVGLVQMDTSLRILAEPVKIEREGITVQVLQGAADSQHTFLVYQIDGIPQNARPTNENVPGCPSPVYLQSADGSKLQITGGDGNGWGTGYDARVTFPALPVGNADVTLMIPCLQDTLPGSVPENWQIPLHFKPAPADMKVFPVYDLAGATSTPIQEMTAPTTTLATEGVPSFSNTAMVNGIRISLDQVIETEAGAIVPRYPGTRMLMTQSIHLPHPPHHPHSTGSSPPGDSIALPIAVEITGDDFAFPKRLDHDLLNRFISDLGELYYELSRSERCGSPRSSPH